MKNLKKLVVLFLAIVLAIGILPLAAFAEEEIHECSEECCSASTRAVPMCTHQYAIMDDYVIIEQTDDAHTYRHDLIYYCVLCGHTYEVEGVPETGAHNWEVVGGIDFALRCKCVFCGMITYMQDFP